MKGHLKAEEILFIWSTVPPLFRCHPSLFPERERFARESIERSPRGVNTLVESIVSTEKVPYWLFNDTSGHFLSREGTAIIAVTLALAAGREAMVGQIMSTAAVGLAGDKLVAGFLPGFVYTDEGGVLDHIYELCNQRMTTAGENLQHASAGVLHELKDLVDARTGRLDYSRFRGYLMKKLKAEKLLVGLIPTDEGLFPSVAILPYQRNVMAD